MSTCFYPYPDKKPKLTGLKLPLYLYRLPGSIHSLLPMLSDRIPIPLRVRTHVAHMCARLKDLASNIPPLRFYRLRMCMDMRIRNGPIRFRVNVQERRFLLVVRRSSFCIDPRQPPILEHSPSRSLMVMESDPPKQHTNEVDEEEHDKEGVSYEGVREGLLEDVGHRAKVVSTGCRVDDEGC